MKTPATNQLADAIIDVADFPRPGIIFKDLTPIFADPQLLTLAANTLSESLKPHLPVDKIIGAEARGFILGAGLASALQAGFIPTRKPGKLPRETRSVEYDLEYGTDSLHMHADAISPGERVVIHDDLLATGGTAAAASQMVQEAGGEIVAFSFIVELGDLNGRSRLPADIPVVSLLEF